MYQWQMDQFKAAEKARKWRVGRSGKRLNTTRRTRNKKIYRYGQPTTVRHKGKRYIRF